HDALPILPSGDFPATPAWFSCSSSRSTETPITSAYWRTVTSGILYALLHSGVLEPRLARRHDQGGGALPVHALDLEQVVHGLFGEVLARHDAAGGQLVGDGLLHAFHPEEILRRFRVHQLLLAGDGAGEHDVARPVAQLADQVVIELLDFQ